jgi:hypothetical protein
MKYLTIILILFPFILNAQSAAFKEIYVTEKTTDGFDTAIKYPVIILKNTIVANKINKAIKERIFWDDESDKAKTIITLLKRDREDRHLYVSYETPLNKNGILSLTLVLEASGAYTTNWNEYFNFDLNTGKEFTVRDLVKPEKFTTFKEEVFERKKDALQQYLLDTKQRVDTGEISQDLYEADTARVAEGGCMDSVSLQTFNMTSSFLEIHDDCFFPHVMMSEAPYYKLKFDLQSLKNILRPEIWNKLVEK